MAEIPARSFGAAVRSHSIDGKSLGALDHDADGWGSGTRARPRRLAVLACAGAASGADLVGGKAGAWQRPSHPAAHTKRWAVLWRCSTRCAPLRCAAEIIQIDAGMTSKASSRRMQAADKGYVMAVKDGQPELLCGSFSAC